MAAPDLGGPVERDRLDALIATVRALKANGIDDPLAAMRAELEGKLRAGAGGKDAADARGALALVNALDSLAAESEPPTR